MARLAMTLKTHIPCGYRQESRNAIAAHEVVTKIEATAKSLAHSLRELAGVQHAQNGADSPEVAAAMAALVEAWGTELGNLTVFVTSMAEKLDSAATNYVSTDAQAADWMEFLPGFSPQLTGR